MKWCCIGFENMLRQAGKRGVAVIVDATRRSGRPEFFLQMRAVDAGAVAQFPDDIPVSLVTEVGIQFCPWCGVSLAEFYAVSAEQVSRPELRIR